MQLLTRQKYYGNIKTIRFTWFDVHCVVQTVEVFWLTCEFNILHSGSTYLEWRRPFVFRLCRLIAGLIIAVQGLWGGGGITPIYGPDRYELFIPISALKHMYQEKQKNTWDKKLTTTWRHITSSLLYSWWHTLRVSLIALLKSQMLLPLNGP